MSGLTGHADGLLTTSRTSPISQEEADQGVRACVCVRRSTSAITALCVFVQASRILRQVLPI